VQSSDIKRHRVLHVVPLLEANGIAKQMSVVAAGLPNGAFESQIIALQATKSAITLAEGHGIGPKIVRRQGELDAANLWRFVQQIRKWKPDILHFWSIRPGAVYLTAVSAAFRTPRVLISLRSGEENPRNSLPLIDRYLAKKATRLVVNGQALHKQYAALGLAGKKLMVIPDGVTPASQRSPSRQELLDQLQLPTDAKLIAFVGSLSKQNRLKELIWGIDQLKAVGINAHLLVIGEGRLRPNLERYAWLNRVEDRVHFLGFRSDVQRLLPQVDVLWQAAGNDGLSNVILEAMAAGVPVVAADTEGDRELVVNAETGYLVPINERAGFARCTLPLLENPELAARLGKAGRNRVQQLHRTEDMLARYADLYQALMNEN
jgi:glycosyltransferase involved in cell wall biosynthesis